MGRIIGLIGCTCLVIAALRLTNLTHVDTPTLKGGESRVGTQEKLSPREHFKRGKELYLRGRYFEAMPHLEEASLSTTGLSASERRQTDDCLNRARAKVQATANNRDPSATAKRKSVVRGQSDPWEDEPASTNAAADEAARDRVDQLMIRAKDAYKAGDKAEAIKLLEMANRCAKDAKLKFAKNELSPGEFLAKLTPVKMDPSEKTSPSSDRANAWATNDRPAAGPSRVNQAVATGNPRDGIQLAGADSEQFELPEAPARSAKPKRTASSQRQPSSLKERAATLVAQAREEIEAGHLEEAKRHALEADELGVSYGVFDDRPELLLADIDRRQNTTTIARKSGPKANSASSRKVVESPSPSQTEQPDDFNSRNWDEPKAANSVVETGSGTGLEQAANSRESETGKKQRALKLLELARRDLQAGNFDSAQAKAEQAQQLNVVYKLFEDMPEVVLNEIEDRRGAENMARKNHNSAGSPLTAESQPSKTVETPPAKAVEAPRAKEMVARARKALEEGHIDEARALAMEADQLKVAFGLFEDNPEMLLNDIARVESKGTNRKVPITSAARTEETDGLALQAEAIALLRQARQMMKEGRYEEARVNALRVQAMDVALPVTADSHDLVLADLDRVGSTKNVASKGGSPSNRVTTADVSDKPFTPGLGRQGELVGASGSQLGEGEEIAEFGQTGLSASELYNRGMAELKRGKRQEAYLAFKAAFESGQRLDPVRTQRLNDYLRDLSPRTSRSGIQLANNQQETLTEPTPMDAAQKEQLVKFERIRAEVLNAVFKAERVKESDPVKVLELIDQTIAKVEGAELSTEAAAPLMKQLNRTRTVLRTQIEEQAPNLVMKEENKRVKAQIQKDIESAIRIDQDMVKLVDEYNDLYKQQRFAEAVIVAKKAKELNPKDPTTVTMLLKAQFALQDKFITDMKSDKEDMRLRMLNDLERSIVHEITDDHPIHYDEEVWKRVGKRKDKYGVNNRIKSEDEKHIDQSLQKRISLHEDNVPLVEVIRKIKAVADINIVFDEAGLEEVGVSSNTAVSIDVDGIQVKSALNLILQRFELAYMVDNEVLKITNRVRQQGNLQVETYSVADLVVPIPNFGSSSGEAPVHAAPASQGHRGFGSHAYLNPGLDGQVFAQVGPMGGGPVGGNGMPVRQTEEWKPGQTTRNTDFSSLTELITSTIAPDSWEQTGGEATLKPFETTLSLVIRQTQKVHEEIADLLAQLRRLQDLQVTIEVRFVTVADRFFERIGIDFDFNIKPSVGYPKYDNTLLPIPTFGSVQIPQSGLNTLNQSGTVGQSGQQTQSQSGQQGQQSQQGQQGQQSQQGQAVSTGLFQPGPTQSLVNNPGNPTIVGLSSPKQFTSDLTIPFTQGSFDVGIPTFGGYNPAAGVQTGIAILSDLEAFFFIQAAQGDQRTNLLFAPKVTLFNGQSATVTDNRARPFVTSLVPTVGFGSVGYTPQITTVNEGITLTATAVVSADRRFVRLTLIPFFRSITDVFTFQVSGAGSGGQSGQGQGQGGFGGGQFGGGGGGGGGQQGGGGGGGVGGGQFGIGGGLGSMQIMQTLFTQVGGGVGGVGGVGGGQQGGGQGGQQAQGGGGGASITVQQPVVETVNVSTTVSVPDGGTVLMGGIKRLKEGRTMSGVPILNKIPYVSRLFKNSGVGRETESLMLMVTPRIIIQEEEEELLGLPRY